MTDCANLLPTLFPLTPVTTASSTTRVIVLPRLRCLIHVISLDGEPTAAEMGKLHSLIESHFGLDRGTADRLIASAMLVEGEAVDLYHFTSVIMRQVDEGGRLRIVEMMWELVYADGQVTEFEDNVLWRAADLLGVSARDRIELKHQVAARGGAGSVTIR